MTEDELFKATPLDGTVEPVLFPVLEEAVCVTEGTGDGVKDVVCCVSEEEDGSNDEAATTLGVSVSILYRLGLAVPKSIDMNAESDLVALPVAEGVWMMAVVTPELTMTVVDPEAYVSGAPVGGLDADGVDPEETTTVVTPELTVTVDPPEGYISGVPWGGLIVEAEEEDTGREASVLLADEDTEAAAGGVEDSVTGHTVV